MAFHALAVLDVPNVKSEKRMRVNSALTDLGWRPHRVPNSWTKMFTSTFDEARALISDSFDDQFVRQTIGRASTIDEAADLAKEEFEETMTSENVWTWRVVIQFGPEDPATFNQSGREWP